jgi:hypothetical protein
LYPRGANTHSGIDESTDPLVDSCVTQSGRVAWMKTLFASGVPAGIPPAAAVNRRRRRLDLARFAAKIEKVCRMNTAIVTSATQENKNDALHGRFER